VSLVPMHGSAITYVIVLVSLVYRAVLDWLY